MSPLLYSDAIHNLAINLRKKGYSIRQISYQLSIAQSTASIWVRNVMLDSFAKKQLIKRREQGKVNARLYLLNKQKTENNILINEINNKMSNEKYSQFILTTLCSYLYWSEGSKSLTNITFVNSDPLMIKTFLLLLRKSFNIDENKFRALVHLHDYHNEKEIKSFWSSISRIPLKQFSKSYRKKHTGKNVHPEYKGCFRIRYYDAKIAKYLSLLYKSTAEYILGL